MFSPAKVRIEDILNSPKQLTIPVYQRDFKWGDDEVRDLIDDLKNYTSADGDKLFLGSMIFEENPDQTIYIVDGQQRITTIMLLLTACMRRASALGMPALAHATKGKIAFIDSTTGETKGRRLIASESIRDVFDYMTSDNWDGKFPTAIGGKQVKRQINRLRPIYDYFESEINDLDRDGLSGFLRAIYDSFVIRIDIEEDVDALSIFERTNARGMELEISDLLKNYLFSKKVPGIEILWPQIVDNSVGTILRMLKYFYIAKKGYILKPQLYRKLKSYAAESTAETLTEELFEFSRFYQMARIPLNNSVMEYFEKSNIPEIYSHQHRYQHIEISLQAMREFGITQFCPPAHASIMSVIRHREEKGEACAKALIRLFHAFENYHFINNVICERVGNEVERLYADSCPTLLASTDIPASIDELIVQLKRRLATEEEFVTKFIELSYATEPVSLLSYIFDRFNNYGLDPSQRLLIYNPDPRLQRKNHNIEHFMPQNPEPELKVKRETLEKVDNIGNLLAISYKTNSRLGNQSPAKKIELLKGELAREIQNTVYVTEFVGKYGEAAIAGWEKEDIEKRANEMALDAYRRIWKIQ